MSGDGERDALSDTVSAEDASPRTAPASPETLRSAPVKPGDAVGRYLIVKRLGTGGMGSVYRARDPELGREVAIKLLHPHLADQRARLLREGQAIARLAHGNVVAIHDVGTYRDGLFIAMELVEGTTLRGWLAAERRPPSVILDAFAHAGAGLAAAHAAGIVHRDFKPDNVLVGSGDPARVVVTDFGLARAFGSDGPEPDDSAPAVDATQTGAFTGTPLYMSPEQFTGGAIGAASDQFSFCIALYEALYRERPFAGGTVAAIMEAVTEQPPKPQPATAAISARVRDAILTGLARDPAARHPSMTALLAALAPPPPPRTHPIFRTLAITGGIAAAAALALAIAVSHRGNGSPRPAAAPPPAPLDACTLATLRIDPLWSPTVRRDAAAALGSGDTAAGDLAHVDAFVARWKHQRETACRAAHPSAAAATCLDHQLADLERVPALWATRSDIVTRHWVPLPDPDRCLRPVGEVVVTSLHDSASPGDPFEVEPSGARYAVEHAGVVRISELATGTQHTYPVAADRELEGWSDATHLIWRSKPTGALVELDTVTGAWRDTPRPPALRLLLATPDWREVAAIPGDGALVVAPRDAGASPSSPEVLAPAGGFGELLSESWSPDARRLATVESHRDASDPGNVDLVIYERARAPNTGTAVVHQRLRGLEDFDNDYEIAWVDPDHVVVEAHVDASEAGDLWIVGGDSLAAFARPPALIVRAEPHTSFVHLARSGSRLIALEATESKTLARIVDGHATPLPHTDDLRIADVTRDGASLLVVADSQAERLATADGTVTPLGHGIGFVHAGRIAVYTVCDGGVPCIVERDATAPATAPPARFASVPSFPKMIGCNAGTCITIASDVRAGSMTVRVLGDDDELGPPVVLHPVDHPDEAEARASPDARHFAVVQQNHSPPNLVVFARDATEVPVPWLQGDATCYPAHTQWIDDATLAVTELCNGPSRVLEVQLGKPPRVLYETPNTIDDLVITADRTLFVAERAYVTKIVALDGL